MDRKTYRINEVIGATGLSRSTIYKLLSTGELRRVKVGSSTLVPAADVDALVLKAPKQQHV
jgi:excisionase family DNA binding protein